MLGGVVDRLVLGGCGGQIGVGWGVMDRLVLGACGGQIGVRGMWWTDWC